MGFKVFPPRPDGPPPPGLYRAEAVIMNSYPLHVHVDREGTVRYCLSEAFRGWEPGSRAKKGALKVRMPPSKRGGMPWKCFVTQEVLTDLARRSRLAEAKEQRVWVALMLETGAFAHFGAELVSADPEVRPARASAAA